MKKFIVLGITLVIFFAVYLYVNSRTIEVVSISPEVFETLPGCKKGNLEDNLKNNYSELEFEKMSKAAELCWQSKLEYIKSSDKPAGVTSEYKFR